MSLLRAGLGETTGGADYVLSGYQEQTAVIRKKVHEICARCDDFIYYWITVPDGPESRTRRPRRKKRFKFCHLCLADTWEQRRKLN